MRKQFLAMAALAVAIGVLVLVYRGPGRSVVRGNVGDGAATLLLYALISFVWTARIRTRALVTFAIAVAIECGQMLWHATSTVGELTIGSTFDPYDIVAYALGVIAAAIFETQNSIMRRKGPPPPTSQPPSVLSRTFVAHKP